MPTRVAINGFGRIGRSTFKNLLSRTSNVEVVAINDLADIKTMVHLLRYDSLYGVYNKKVSYEGDNLLIGGTAEDNSIKVLSEKDPAGLPWKEMDIDVVLECTGIFRHKEDAEKHLEAGAKKVIISAPGKSQSIPTYLPGVNEDKYSSKNDDVLSMGSCTTNCLAPVAKVLDEEFGIENGFMTTVHSYTNSQQLLDAPHDDLRRARAAAENIIPTTTGAASTVEKALPQLKGKLGGLALRIPTPTVSIVDFVAQMKKTVISEEVNYTLKKASQRQDLKGVLGVEDAPLVSRDFKGSSYSSIVDSSSTGANGTLVKLLLWYDNEWGYSAKLAEFTEFVGDKL